MCVTCLQSFGLMCIFWVYLTWCCESCESLTNIAVVVVVVVLAVFVAFILRFIWRSVLHCMLCVLPRDRCTNIQRRAASPSVDVFISFEQTIETLRDRLQQSDFDLCRVSFCPLRWPLNSLPPHCGAFLAVCLSVISIIVRWCRKKSLAVFGIFSSYLKYQDDPCQRWKYI